jgi:peptide/nickel transport system permease protein
VLGYIGRRLIQLVIVLIGVTIITFLIMFLIPGDPAYLLAGKNATPQRVAEVRHNLGLDQPIYRQYVSFVNRLVHGDFGESYQFERPVREMLFQAIPVTVQLAVAAVLLELLGIPLGVYSALRQYTFWDTALTTTALLIWGIPVFVLAIFLQWFFGLKLSVWTGLNIFPIVGIGGNTFLWVIPRDWANLSALILPAIAVGLVEIAYISYMQRASMLEVIRTDYVRTARAKGLSERSVVLKHSLKNALIPVMTVAGIDLGALLGGAIITETVFQRPGVGRMIYQAITARDLPVVAAGVLFATFAYVIANLVVDIAYAYVDPRIRYE